MANERKTKTRLKKGKTKEAPAQQTTGQEGHRGWSVYCDAPVFQK